MTLSREKFYMTFSLNSVPPKKLVRLISMYLSETIVETRKAGSSLMLFQFIVVLNKEMHYHLYLSTML